MQSQVLNGNIPSLLAEAIGDKASLPFLDKILEKKPSKNDNLCRDCTDMTIT